MGPQNFGQNHDSFSLGQTPLCQLCHQTGHIAAYCSLLPQNFQVPQAHLTHGGDSNIRDLDWYIDSGATHHVTADFSNLNIQENRSSPEQLLIGDGSGLPIISSGSSTLTTPTHSFALTNILCAPHISKNLLSVPKFAKDNSCFFELHPNFFVVKDLHTHRELLRGTLKDGLYCLQSRSTSPSPIALLSTSSSSSLWHE